MVGNAHPTQILLDRHGYSVDRVDLETNPEDFVDYFLDFQRLFFYSLKGRKERKVLPIKEAEYTQRGVLYRYVTARAASITSATLGST
jgi:hypothetical protein